MEGKVMSNISNKIDEISQLAHDLQVAYDTEIIALHKEIQELKQNQHKEIIAARVEAYKRGYTAKGIEELTK